MDVTFRLMHHSALLQMVLDGEGFNYPVVVPVYMAANQVIETAVQLELAGVESSIELMHKDGTKSVVICNAMEFDSVTSHDELVPYDGLCGKLKRLNESIKQSLLISTSQEETL